MLRVVTGAVVSYCLGHAQNRAGEMGSRMLWLAPGLTLCPRCSRVVSPRVRHDHFDAEGVPCRLGLSLELPEQRVLA
jgi:hypothetical protein